TQPMTINGEAIPADTISEAIDAADARYWIPTPELLEAVIKMVIRQEAKASGDNRKDIRADAGRVQDLIAAARLGIGDQQFALGNDPNLRSVLEMIEPADMPKLQAVVLSLVKNIVMAKQARAAGLHKDAAFAQQSAQAAASRARGRTELLVRLYLDKHLDAGAAPGAAKAMIASLRDGVKIEYLLD
ncbi:MAG: hypothetical protein QF773_11100, partial [Lentisphaeria bacterium]|nr:hypothetical protein [Lentisphaeria bacterium]